MRQIPPRGSHRPTALPATAKRWQPCRRQALGTPPRLERGVGSTGTGPLPGKSGR